MQNFNLKLYRQKWTHEQKNEDWVNWRGLFLGRLRFFIEENTDVKNLNKTNGGDLLHILQDTL